MIVRVTGYHGTTATRADAILREGFLPSSNWYDWLGDGVYFWQDAPRRAEEWAVQHFGRDAAVLAAAIELDTSRCVDLLYIGWADALAGAYRRLARERRRAGSTLPTQRGLAHSRDRAVVNFLAASLRSEGLLVRAVRGAFVEGRRVFAGSAIYDRAHVQIAVRDTAIIQSPQRVR